MSTMTTKDIESKPATSLDSAPKASQHQATQNLLFKVKDRIRVLSPESNELEFGVVVAVDATHVVVKLGHNGNFHNFLHDAIIKL